MLKFQPRLNLDAKARARAQTRAAATTDKVEKVFQVNRPFEKFGFGFSVLGRDMEANDESLGQNFMRKNVPEVGRIFFYVVLACH